MEDVTMLPLDEMACVGQFAQTVGFVSRMPERAALMEEVDG